jgi:hypothetical protein
VIVFVVVSIWGRYVPLKAAVEAWTAKGPRARKDPECTRTSAGEVKLTIPHEFHFRVDERLKAQPPREVLTTEQREALAVASFPAFKARPLDPRVLNSIGDLGVPRVEKAQLTVPTSPEFRSEARLAARAQSRHSSPEATKAEFHALPFNPAVFQEPVIRAVSPKKLTKPTSPDFASKHMPQRAAAAALLETEMVIPFRARPVPASNYHAPSLPTKSEGPSVTVSQPFQLATSARGAEYELAMAAQRMRDEEEARQKMQFKATPMMLAPDTPVQVAPRVLQVLEAKVHKILEAEIGAHRSVSCLCLCLRFGCDD